MPALTATGLRQPIEVWALQIPRENCRHGLISGHRLSCPKRAAYHRADRHLGEAEGIDQTFLSETFPGTGLY